MNTSMSRHVRASSERDRVRSAVAEPASGPGRVRWARPVDRHWRSERYEGRLPDDFESRVWSIGGGDRRHSKQGRSTERVRLVGPAGVVSVYLKRHARLGLTARAAARLDPGGAHTPGEAERRHLEHARALGIRVPDVVAAGACFGPNWEARSYLAVAELTGMTALHEAIPLLRARLDEGSFARFKGAMTAALAEVAARLHGRRCFHQDLYLCHFFVDVEEAAAGRVEPTLIDWHRMVERRLTPLYKQAKDLAQLLYSTYEVEALDDVDRSRLTAEYTRALGGGGHAALVWLAGWKASRYLRHNRRSQPRA